MKKIEKSFANMQELSKAGFLRYPDEFVVGYFARNSWNRVLDFGCSTGRHTKVLCELASERETGICDIGGGQQVKLKNHTIYALDLDIEVLALAKKRAPYSVTITPEQINIRPETSLDSVLTWNCLHMNSITEQEKIIKTFNRLLKQGGTIVSNHISTKDSKHTTNSIENIVEYKSKNRSYEIILYFYNLEKIKEIYTKNGFDIIEIYKRTKENLLNNHIVEYYLIVAQKK